MNSKKGKTPKSSRRTTTEQRIAARQAAFLEEVLVHLKNLQTDSKSLSPTLTGHLANDLLGLSALKHQLLPDPPLPLRFERLDLRPLMEQLLQSMKQLAGNLEVSLEYIEKTNQESAYILMDPQYLLQAFQCLLQNAILWSPKGKSARLALMKSHTEYVVEILDQGSGIDSEIQSCLYTPYYTTREKKEKIPAALGLGLAYARKIIEQHSGILDIRSKTDRGTVAFMHFPSA